MNAAVNKIGRKKKTRWEDEFRTIAGPTRMGSAKLDLMYDITF